MTIFQYRFSTGSKSFLCYICVHLLTNVNALIESFRRLRFLNGITKNFNIFLQMLKKFRKFLHLAENIKSLVDRERHRTVILKIMREDSLSFHFRKAKLFNKSQSYKINQIFKMIELVIILCWCVTSIKIKLLHCYDLN